MTFPGTRPARRVHVPPPPAGQLPEPDGADSAEKAFRRQQQVASAYGAYRASIPDGVDPNELRDSAGVYAYTDQALSLAPALNAVKADADAASKKISDLIHGTRVGDDVASQLAAQRAWSRAQRTLDAVNDIPEVIAAAQNLIANADDAQVRVLAEELSSYLDARNAPSGWLPNALADKVPGLKDAHSEAIVKARQLAVLQQNHHSLTRAMAKEVAAPQLLDPSQVSATPYSDGSV